mgnify:CR=1 FL=1
MGLAAAKPCKVRGANFTNVLMCQSANVLMVCSAKAKLFSVNRRNRIRNHILQQTIVERRACPTPTKISGVIESTLYDRIQSRMEMTLKGSNIHTKNAYSLNHNPVGVEFFKKNIVDAGHALRLRRFRIIIENNHQKF